MHIAEAQRLTQTQIPWICDNMENELKEAMGGAPNGEIVIDPEGKIVRKRFWSDATTLRSDLETLVGKVDSPTQIADLKVRFQPETRDIASGVVPRLELPAHLMALIVTPLPNDKDIPFYVKLRAETSYPALNAGEGDLYLHFYVDPLHKVHWNNRLDAIRVEFVGDSAKGVKPSEAVGPKVDEPADIDPRQFKIAFELDDLDQPLELKIDYAICDDAETFCLKVTQKFQVLIQADPFGGSRPDIFMPGMFADMRSMDKNGDGNLSHDEFPPGEASLYIGHVDKNGNGCVESNEIDEFMQMFNNGQGFRSNRNDGDDGS